MGFSQDKKQQKEEINMLQSEYSKTYIQSDSRAVANRIITRWYDELQLNVAPTCNMLCNFCSKGSDCICNGNDPSYHSRMFTPRQAVNWAVSTISKDKRIKVVKISGPGEPLGSSQTFEVMKRLGQKLPEVIFGISTNGLRLEEKAEALESMGVRLVTIAINAVRPETITKLYSKLILDNDIISGPGLSAILHDRQMKGLRKCIRLGMTVNVNTVYFPGINDEDIELIAQLCKDSGIASMCLIAGFPGGKFARMRVPSVTDMVAMQQKIGKILPEVQIRTFI